MEQTEDLTVSTVYHPGGEPDAAANGSNGAANGSSNGFPYLTVLATVLALFLFAALVLLAYYSSYDRAQTRGSNGEELVDPRFKLEELRAKNQAILEGRPGSGAKMPVAAAEAELLSRLPSETDRLPFPRPPLVLEEKATQPKK